MICDLMRILILAVIIKLKIRQWSNAEIACSKRINKIGAKLNNQNWWIFCNRLFQLRTKTLQKCQGFLFKALSTHKPQLCLSIELHQKLKWHFSSALWINGISAITRKYNHYHQITPWTKQLIIRISLVQRIYWCNTSKNPKFMPLMLSPIWV